MALNPNTPFYLELEFSNQKTFGVIGATKTLAIVKSDLQNGAEKQSSKRGGSVMVKGALMRKTCTFEAWFQTESQAAYPDGQDFDDWLEVCELYLAYRYMRVSDCNTLDFVENTRAPALPWMVVFAGDMVISKHDSQLYKTGTFNLMSRARS